LQVHAKTQGNRQPTKRIKSYEELQRAAAGRRGRVWTILESGYHHTKYQNDFFSLGTDFILPVDYLEKPFLLEEFALEVRVALEYVRKRKLALRQ